MLKNIVFYKSSHNFYKKTRLIHTRKFFFKLDSKPINIVHAKLFTNIKIIINFYIKR